MGLKHIKVTNRARIIPTQYQNTFFQLGLTLLKMTCFTKEEEISQLSSQYYYQAEPQEGLKIQGGTRSLISLINVPMTLNLRNDFSASVQALYVIFHVQIHVCKHMFREKWKQQFEFMCKFTFRFMFAIPQKRKREQMLLILSNMPLSNSCLNIPVNKSCQKSIFEFMKSNIT